MNNTQADNNNKKPAAPTVTVKKHDSLEPRLKDWFGWGLRFIVPIACSVLLVIWLFHKVNFKEMMDVIHHGVNFWWIGVMMVLTPLSMMIRGYRWGLQLKGVGVNPPLMTLFCSIWGDYALDLMFPQLGEAWRCLYISKKSKVSLSTVVGTDIGDRASDLAVIILLFILMLFVAGGAINAFLAKYAIGREVVKFTDNPWMWALIALVIGSLVMIGHLCRHYKFMDKIDGSLERIWQGFKVLFTMKHKLLYVILTIAIWVVYFLKTYVCFFAFPFTLPLTSPHYALGLLPGLVCFVFGSMSIAIPSNGGLGPWNLAVMFGLSLYGIGDTEGAAFAMLVWSCQQMIVVAMGIFTLIYVMLTKNKIQKNTEPTEASPAKS